MVARSTPIVSPVGRPHIDGTAPFRGNSNVKPIRAHAEHPSWNQRNGKPAVTRGRKAKGPVRHGQPGYRTGVLRHGRCDRTWPGDAWNVRGARGGTAVPAKRQPEPKSSASDPSPVRCSLPCAVERLHSGPASRRARQAGHSRGRVDSHRSDVVLHRGRPRHLQRRHVVEAQFRRRRGAQPGPQGPRQHVRHSGLGKRRCRNRYTPN